MSRSEEFSFKRFAEHGFYKIVNAKLIDMIGLRPGQRIVDLACGPGAATRLILEKLRGGGKTTRVIGVDSSATALKEAKEQLRDVRDAVIQFVHSRAEELSRTIRGKVDVVVFCNGIHYIQDKGRLLSEVFKTLKGGGVFAFNTSFYQGAHLPETDTFYRRWMLKALRILKSRYGLLPAQEKVEARRQLSPEQYGELLQDQGFRVVRKEIHTAQVPLEGWLDISSYEDFITGVMPRVPLDKASAALKEGVMETFKELGLSFVPRNWLEMVATKAVPRPGRAQP